VIGARPQFIKCAPVTRAIRLHNEGAGEMPRKIEMPLLQEKPGMLMIYGDGHASENLVTLVGKYA
jgi:UDP-N-acetylglucosamine 2-epimerase